MRFLKNNVPENLIFDLGGVIIDLKMEMTKKAFASLSGKQEKDMEQFMENSLFIQYEKGLIADAEFRDRLRGLLKINCSDEKLDKAWNAMLGDIPKVRINLLERLRGNHKLFLLSNTNQIHLTCFNNIVKSVCGEESLERYFDKVYYSHVLKMRKPDIEIFKHVLSENDLVAKDTLFLDDNTTNLEGASQTGIQTFHVRHPDLLFSLFS